ncbi:hypothetical protein SAMN05660748_1073 [Blastococcus aggregatus]|uniref:Uncharacterized protein n=1 Tax=Blastococcus aggregatus TaxID=38502 RepID=A0A285V107_9ACTN|nr:hypothetical protein [Blastococcus aggregatus]SOC47845.1 hypothetical protein SAMN05660748_1073 [Blastococcus aggregatus]
METAASTQARRLADHRTRLLNDGALIVPDSGEKRDSGRSPAGTALFTVQDAGQTLAPAFQFAADGSPRPELRPLVSTLTAGGVDGWQLWSWLTASSSYLSGGVPQEVACTQPERALRAAERFVATSAP